MSRIRKVPNPAKIFPLKYLTWVDWILIYIKHFEIGYLWSAEMDYMP